MGPSISRKHWLGTGTHRIHLIKGWAISISLSSFHHFSSLPFFFSLIISTLYTHKKKCCFFPFSLTLSFLTNVHQYLGLQCGAETQHRHSIILSFIFIHFILFNLLYVRLVLFGLLFIYIESRGNDVESLIRKRYTCAPSVISIAISITIKPGRQAGSVGVVKHIRKFIYYTWEYKYQEKKKL